MTIENKQHKAEDFYDDSYVRELDQSGYIDKVYADAKTAN
jgi:hypothetical protein